MDTRAITDVVIGYGLAVIAAIVWFVRLEGRVNLLDRVLMDALAERKTAMAELLARVTRIEQKVDNIQLRCAAYNHGLAPPFEAERDDD